MGRCPVLEGFENLAETLADIFPAIAEDGENLLLQLSVVDADAATGQLGSVANKVVGFGANEAQVSVVQKPLLSVGRGGKGMVRGIPAARIFIPFEQGEVGHESKGQFVRVRQIEQLSHVIAHGVQPDIDPGRRSRY